MAERQPRRPPRPPRTRIPGSNQMAMFDVPGDTRPEAVKKKYVLDYQPRKPRAPRGPAQPAAASTPSPVPTSAPNGGAGAPARAKAQRAMRYDTALAIQEAREGDDSILLPYQPTPSINPPRPRTLAAGYDKDAKVMRIRFRDGAGYEYYDVDPNEWRNFKRVKSPGKFINRRLNAHPYSRADW